MTESIGLCYFSGTGNTQVVAELLETALKRHGAEVTTVRMEHVLQDKVQFDPQAFDLVGIGHPIHGFDVPRIVYDFVNRLPQIANKRTFILKTAADFISVNNGASKSVIRRLRHKGYNVFYDRIICMPSNWAMKYEDAFAKQLCYVAIAKADHMADEVLAGKSRVLRVNPLFRWTARLVSRGEDLGARLFGRMLRITDACTDCGRCIDNCPTANIRRQDNKIAFGYSCVFCMRCIYSCPQKAIVPRFGRFCVLKDGYDVRAIINNSDIEGNFVTAETRGFYRHFVRYILNVEV
jgi:ferredoxin/flavodoxin